jgi:hypothetical protein
MWVPILALVLSGSAVSSFQELKIPDLPEKERMQLLRQMRVLLAKMDILASSAQRENEQYMVQFPWNLS